MSDYEKYRYSVPGNRQQRRNSIRYRSVCVFTLSSSKSSIDSSLRADPSCHCWRDASSAATQQYKAEITFGPELEPRMSRLPQEHTYCCCVDQLSDRPIFYSVLEALTAAPHAPGQTSRAANRGRFFRFSRQHTIQSISDSKVSCDGFATCSH